MNPELGLCGVRRRVAAFKARTRHTRASALVRAFQRMLISESKFKKVTTLNQNLTILFILRFAGFILLKILSPA